MGLKDFSGLSEFELLTMLARPETSTVEITVLAKKVTELIDQQDRLVNLVSDLIDYMRETEGGG